MCVGTSLASVQSTLKRYLPDFHVKSEPETNILDQCCVWQWKAVYFSQGLSVAGSQKGLDDGRSNLVKEIFKVYDRMPNGFGPEYF